MPGSLRSSTYCPAPVSSAGSSRRTTDAPKYLAPTCFSANSRHRNDRQRSLRPIDQLSTRSRELTSTEIGLGACPETLVGGPAAIQGVAVPWGNGLYTALPEGCHACDRRAGPHLGTRPAG